MKMFEPNDLVRVIKDISVVLPVGSIGTVLEKCECASAFFTYLLINEIIYNVKGLSGDCACLPGVALKKIEGDPDAGTKFEATKQKEAVT